ncbi:hypothetical protein SLA2020_267960 [Shorea laevis]
MMPMKHMLVMKLILGFVYINLFLDSGESSYPGVDGGYHDHHMRRMALAKATHIVSQLQSSSKPLVLSKSRVIHVTEYGADPRGRLDSTEALQQAISDAFRSPVDGHLMEGVADLGGTEVHLDGGTYKISRPLRFPDTSGGNFMIHGGSLRASDDFPTDGHLIELCPSSASLLYEDVTLKDLMINSNFRGGGISVINSLRTTIDNCYVSHFTTNGILIQGGHETYVRNCFIGQHINVGGDRRERHFSGIGINIMGNDNAVTDVVIFSGSIGIMVSGQANVLTGIHCYNKATRWGGSGIYIKAPGLTQTRIVNSYFDFTGVVAEDPVQLQITGSFFLGNAFVLIKSLAGVVCGVNIVDNMFSGNRVTVETDMPLSATLHVSVDQSMVGYI